MKTTHVAALTSTSRHQGKKTLRSSTIYLYTHVCLPVYHLDPIQHPVPMQHRDEAQPQQGGHDAAGAVLDDLPVVRAPAPEGREGGGGEPIVGCVRVECFESCVRVECFESLKSGLGRGRGNLLLVCGRVCVSVNESCVYVRDGL